MLDPNDAREDVRILSYLEHTIQDARIDRSGNRRVISRQMQFVELDGQGQASMAGAAPYLDYRPLADDERALVTAVFDQAWLQDDLEGKALAYAVDTLVPGHLADVRQRREELVAKPMAAVKERLTKEIAYWDHRAKVRLLRRDELAADWDPTRDRRITVWEVTQHLIRALEQEGETITATLVQRVGGLGEVARDLAYRLYGVCERKRWAQEALAYNSLVIAWPEIVRLAGQHPPQVQEGLF